MDFLWFGFEVRSTRVWAEIFPVSLLSLLYELSLLDFVSFQVVVLPDIVKHGQPFRSQCLWR